jgi:hypothetical protein
VFPAKVSSVSAFCSGDRLGPIGAAGGSSQKASGKVMKTYNFRQSIPNQLSLE